jgi:hypothetical protein
MGMKVEDVALESDCAADAADETADAIADAALEATAGIDEVPMMGVLAMLVARGRDEGAAPELGACDGRTDCPTDEAAAGTLDFGDGTSPGVNVGTMPGVKDATTPGVDDGMTPGMTDGVCTALNATAGGEARGELLAIGTGTT